MDREELAKLDVIRLRLLHRLYDLDDPRRTYHDLSKILPHIGADRDEYRMAMEYLIGEQLGEAVGRRHDSARITHLGRKEVEDALREPSEPTDHFSPATISLVFNNAQFTDSSVNVAGRDLTQEPPKSGLWSWFTGLLSNLIGWFKG